MPRPAHSRVLGSGFFVPPKVVTNHDLAKMFDTSHEWILQRTGIKERRFSVEGETPAYLAEKAARAACEDAGVDLSEIDMILVGTLSPDAHFPGTSAFLQERLGIPGVACMDIRNQCTGFVYGMATADAFIRTGMYKRVLVVGTEVHSTGLDFSNEGRDVTVLFGDGAGAFVMGPSEDASRGVFSSHLHCDGRYARDLWTSHPASAQFPTRLAPEDIAGPGSNIYPKMQGKAVFKQAVTRLPQVIREALEANGVGIDEIDVLVPHQANRRINEMVSNRLGFPPEKVIHTIERYGNTTAASIPMAFHAARQEGLVKEGSMVLIAAFGSGFTWGSLLMRF